VSVSVQFIRGLDEEISEISLGRAKQSGNRVVKLTFNRLQAMEKLRSFTSGVEYVWLEDEEGEIQVTPKSIKFFYKNDDDLARVDCSFEVHTAELYARVERFIERYTQSNGLEFEAPETTT
jgi:photosystem II Psb28-2 protein